ncbi:MAG: class I SAM-dependent methyltransferase [Acidimicrobiia bacterium]
MVDVQLGALGEAPTSAAGSAAGPASARVEQLAAVLARGTASYGYDDFGIALDAVLRLFAPRRVLEIGAGRAPFVNPANCPAATITINDIDPGELERADPHLRKLCFDISGPELPDERFDFVFSRSVLEHVPDGRQAWRNSLRLLDAGGVALHFFPTLFSPPFVANRLLPERLTLGAARLLRIRDLDAEPKFPARYSWCRASAGLERNVRALGFSATAIVPYYDHGYFRRLGPIDRWNTALQQAAQRRDLRVLASYAFLIAVR